MSDKWYLSYKTIKHSKDGRIYFPLTPCEWLDKPKVEKIIVVRMSCGGGMGGSRWNEYLLDDDIKDGLNTYTRVDGIKVKINSAYVVRVVYGMYFVKVKYKHYNSNFKETIRTEQELYVLSDVKDVKLVDDYKSLAEVDD